MAETTTSDIRPAPASRGESPVSAVKITVEKKVPSAVPPMLEATKAPIQDDSKDSPQHTLNPQDFLASLAELSQDEILAKIASQSAEISTGRQKNLKEAGNWFGFQNPLKRNENGRPNFSPIRIDLSKVNGGNILSRVRSAMDRENRETQIRQELKQRFIAGGNARLLGIRFNVMTQKYDELNVTDVMRIRDEQQKLEEFGKLSRFGKDRTRWQVLHNELNNAKVIGRNKTAQEVVVGNSADYLAALTGQANNELLVNMLKQMQEVTPKVTNLNVTDVDKAATMLTITQQLFIKNFSSSEMQDTFVKLGLAQKRTDGSIGLTPDTMFSLVAASRVIGAQEITDTNATDILQKAFNRVALLHQVDVKEAGWQGRRNKLENGAVKEGDKGKLAKIKAMHNLQTKFKFVGANLLPTLAALPAGPWSAVVARVVTKFPSTLEYMRQSRLIDKQAGDRQFAAQYLLTDKYAEALSSSFGLSGSDRRGVIRRALTQTAVGAVTSGVLGGVEHELFSSVGNVIAGAAEHVVPQSKMVFDWMNTQNSNIEKVVGNVTKDVKNLAKGAEQKYSDLQHYKPFEGFAKDFDKTLLGFGPIKWAEGHGGVHHEAPMAPDAGKFNFSFDNNAHAHDGIGYPGGHTPENSFDGGTHTETLTCNGQTETVHVENGMHFVQDTYHPDGSHYMLVTDSQNGGPQQIIAVDFHQDSGNAEQFDFRVNVSNNGKFDVEDVYAGEGNNLDIGFKNIDFSHPHDFYVNHQLYGPDHAHTPINIVTKGDIAFSSPQNGDYALQHIQASGFGTNVRLSADTTPVGYLRVDNGNVLLSNNASFNGTNTITLSHASVRYENLDNLQNLGYNRTEYAHASAAQNQVNPGVPMEDTSGHEVYGVQTYDLSNSDLLQTNPISVAGPVGKNLLNGLLFQTNNPIQTAAEWGALGLVAGGAMRYRVNPKASLIATGAGHGTGVLTGAIVGGTLFGPPGAAAGAVIGLGATGTAAGIGHFVNTVRGVNRNAVPTQAAAAATPEVVNADIKAPITTETEPTAPGDTIQHPTPPPVLTPAEQELQQNQEILNELDDLLDYEDQLVQLKAEKDPGEVALQTDIASGFLHDAITPEMRALLEENPQFTAAAIEFEEAFKAQDIRMQTLLNSYLAQHPNINALLKKEKAARTPAENSELDAARQEIDTLRSGDTEYLGHAQKTQAAAGKMVPFIFEAAKAEKQRLEATISAQKPPAKKVEEVSKTDSVQVALNLDNAVPEDLHNFTLPDGVNIAEVLSQTELIPQAELVASAQKGIEALREGKAIVELPHANVQAIFIGDVHARPDYVLAVLNQEFELPDGTKIPLIEAVKQKKAQIIFGGDLLHSEEGVMALEKNDSLLSLQTDPTTHSILRAPDGQVLSNIYLAARRIAVLRANGESDDEIRTDLKQSFSVNDDQLAEKALELSTDEAYVETLKHLNLPENATNEQIRTIFLEVELRHTASVMQSIMELKAAYPEYVNVLLGTHDQFVYGVQKGPNQSAVFAEMIQASGYQEFAQKLKEWSEKLPYVITAGNVIYMHTTPGTVDSNGKQFPNLTRLQIEQRDPLALEAFTLHRSSQDNNKNGQPQLENLLKEFDVPDVKLVANGHDDQGTQGVGEENVNGIKRVLVDSAKQFAYIQVNPGQNPTYTAHVLQRNAGRGLINQVRARKSN